MVTLTVLVAAPTRTTSRPVRGLKTWVHETQDTLALSADDRVWRTFVTSATAPDPMRAAALRAITLIGTAGLMTVMLGTVAASGLPSVPTAVTVGSKTVPSVSLAVPEMTPVRGSSFRPRGSAPVIR